MQRRHFIRSMAAPAVAIGSGRLFAGTGQQPRLLLVFLRGAYDCANLLVPISSDFYYAARPDIAIARPSADTASALALNADWGLHPALRDSIYPMFQSGQASFVPFAGTEDSSRSHFQTQDGIELGQPLDQSRNYQSGFLNRLATLVQGAAPMAFTDRLPLALRGSMAVPNTTLRAVARTAVDARQSAIIDAMYQGTGLAGAVSGGFAVRDEVAREMALEMDASSRSAVSTRGFELEARRVARLMRARYTIGFVDVGGWDTHVGQGGASGYLATRLEELGRGLCAYAQEMGPLWRATTVVVLSEFGRTLRQNGNRGTDHGHGSAYWVLGGGMAGGKVLGEQVRVDASTLFENRDLPVLNDYRALLGGLFARQYGLNATQLAQVFPGSAPRDLGLL